jgi:ATP-binding protein involved in chromosome partitioning
VEAALKRIRDPETGDDVVTSGLVRGLEVRDGRVSFALEVSAERGRRAEPLRAACEAAVRAVEGVAAVTAVLTAQRPTPSGAPRTASPVQPVTAGARLSSLSGVGAIVAVASGKGGVGKSTIAVNLALGLVALGQKVGLLDADIYGPSVPRLLGLRDKPRVEGKKVRPLEAFGLKAMSIGFLIEEDTPMVWRGPMVAGALTQLIADVDWGRLDVLVVDMPPGTGDVQLTLAQRVPLAGAVIVSTPQDIALVDARKGIAMFQKTEVPILGIVENMSVFICPHCGQPSHIFGHGGARATAERMGVPFLGEVPLVSRIREFSDQGLPITATQPQSKEAETFRAIAQAVSEGLTVARKPAPRIVIH